MLSTGDLKGSLRKLDSSLRAIKYPREVDYNGLSKGDPSSFLPIVSFTLTSFSPLLAEQLVGAGLELTGKTDLRFTDTVYKVLRDVFQYKPILSKQQFLQWGFSQRKISVTCDIISLALQRHNQLRKPRPRPPVSVSGGRVEAVPPEGDTAKHTDYTLPGRPLVERHIGGPSPFHREPSHTSISPSHCPMLGNTQIAGSREEEEEDELIAPAVEGRLSALEGQLQSLLSGLDGLTALETRLERLERWRDSDKTVDKSDTITVERQSWENLLSRVLLLETKLELADRQKEISLVNGRRGHHVAEETPTTCQSNYHEPIQSSGPTPSFPISPGGDAPQEVLKDRLERIATMMKETSSLLKSAEPSM